MAGAQPTLTEAQRRHLQIVLGGLIVEAEQLREWAERSERQAGSEERRWLSRLCEQLEELIDAVRHGAAALGIAAHRREADPRRKIAAWSSTWWSHVLDCRPHALRAYGQVDPRLEKTLTPLVEGVAERLLRMQRDAES